MCSHMQKRHSSKKFQTQLKMLAPYFYLQFFSDNADLPFSQMYPAVVIPKPWLSLFSSTVNFSISGSGVSGGIMSMLRAGRDGVLVKIGAAPSG